MTEPRRGPDDLAPAGRTRGRATESAALPSEYDDVEVARGQSAAVLGALSRMQLRLDVMSREQTDALSKIDDRLLRLEEQIGRMIS